MQVKRFRGTSMQEVLEAVKTELGEEAVILKSEKIPRSGLFDLMKKENVEVVAAVDVGSNHQEKNVVQATPSQQPAGVNAARQDRPVHGSKRRGKAPVVTKPTFSTMLRNRVQDAYQSNSKMMQARSRGKTSSIGVPDSITERPGGKRGSGGHPDVKTAGKSADTHGSNEERRMSSVTHAEPAGTETTHSGTIHQLRKEVDELRTLVKTVTGRMDATGGMLMKDFSECHPLLYREMLALVESGVEMHIARKIIEKAASPISDRELFRVDHLRQSLVEQIEKTIKTAGPIKCKKGKPKVIALVGPTGVGKTTTLAKLAANSKFVFDKKVSLISADTYRMSAIEHLNTFAGIAHLPISAVYSPCELKASLDAQQDKDLIFIDTAGRSPREENHIEELKHFMESAEPDEIHLVLPANTKNQDLLDAVRRFSVLPVSRIVVSKIDETSTPGSILNIAAEVDSPISYITNGQVIPDDIALANSQNLARMIMKVA